MSTAVRMFRPLAMRASAARPSLAMRMTAQRRFINMQPTQRLRAVPKEEHAAHTISQRLRSLKKIPPELLPLGFVIAFALVIAVYALIHKLFSDKTLRLHRRGNVD